MFGWWQFFLFQQGGNGGYVCCQVVIEIVLVEVWGDYVFQDVFGLCICEVVLYFMFGFDVQVVQGFGIVFGDDQDYVVIDVFVVQFLGVGYVDVVLFDGFGCGGGYQ